MKLWTFLRSFAAATSRFGRKVTGCVAMPRPGH